MDIKDFPRYFTARLQEAKMEIDQITQSFKQDLIDEIRNQAPSNLKKLVIDEAIQIEFEDNRLQLRVKSNTSAGRILIIHELGIPHSYKIDAKDMLLKFEGTNEWEGQTLIRDQVEHPAQPPEYFIRRAWKLVSDRYRKRIVRAINKIAGGQ